MVLGSDASRDYVEVVVGQRQSRMGPIYSPPPPGSFLSGRRQRARSAASTFGLHDACDVFERAADSLHRAWINTELLGNDAHTWPSGVARAFLMRSSSAELSEGGLAVCPRSWRA